ncbi:hypothetical protein VE03_06876 [Pseudogymnoascus sp. 23342-1-I1]|nr:hypothetical protein VE03_06876 [Pseudogymnoascus sp. 23342-1-I1]
MAEVTDFNINNIPFGIISTADNPHHRPATIIENTVIDLCALENEHAFTNIPSYPTTNLPFQCTTLSRLASLSHTTRLAVRKRIQQIYLNKNTAKHDGAVDKIFWCTADVTNHLPFESRVYTDYVSSLGHMANIQSILSPPPHTQLSPLYHAPLGYHSNPRSIIISGTPVSRFIGPIEGQFQTEMAARVGPSEQFDFEVELGIYIGRESSGEAVGVEEADDYVFGFVLLNDWSARDIQRAESGGPTGPFLAKSGAVSISPWVVTLDAVEEARTVRNAKVGAGAPEGEYLKDANGMGALDIRCSARWERGGREFEVCEADYSEMYWGYRQLIAHQTMNGARVGTGDLIGTGTMSKFESDEMGRACLFERNYNGSKGIDCGEGDQRTWLEDGDEVSLSGWVFNSKTGVKMFGFGSCVGTVAPR